MHVALSIVVCNVVYNELVYVKGISQTYVACLNNKKKNIEGKSDKFIAFSEVY